MRPWVAGIFLFILVLNAGYAALVIWLLRRLISKPRWPSVAVATWAALMSGLLLLQAFAPSSWTPFIRHWLYFPMAVHMVWNILFIQLLFLGAILVVLAVRIFHPRPTTAPVPAQENGLSRRRFLYLAACGVAPATAIGMGVHGTLTYHDLRVRQLSIPIADLSPELEGFTIAHVSDLHSGIFCGPSRLRNIHNSTNDLKADLIVITGDIINHEMAEFPAALQAMQGLESRHGIYLCEGNHDVIPGAGLVLEACLTHGLPMLYNSATTLSVNGKRILLAGLPWFRAGSVSPSIDQLYPARQEGDVRILLAHHPHLFDAPQSTDLVLAGHTHGGQIMLSDDIGLGPAFFKYWSGFYQRGNSSMVVSNGCGDWFPCRIGAPAEIGLLRLTKKIA